MLGIHLRPCWIIETAIRLIYFYTNMYTIIRNFGMRNSHFLRDWAPSVRMNDVVDGHADQL